MQENLINGAARPDALRALDKARIAKTWQQYYEDRGYQPWGFSPSPTARIASLLPGAQLMVANFWVPVTGGIGER